ncbi:glycosyl hydrolase family 18 protein [Francisellaceae bacterium CB300]|jgi:chitinase
MKKLFGNIVLSGILVTSIVSIVFAADTKKTDEIKKVVKESSSNNAKSLLPKRILGGFLNIRTPSSTTRVDIKKVKEDGYNLMIVGFGEIYGTDIGFYTSDSSSSVATQTAIEKIKEAKKLGLSVLLAVGGVPNTFHPGVERNSADPKILGKGMSDEQINTLAQNIVNFLKKNSLDGIEYSVKKYTSPTFFNKLSAKIKDIDKNLVVAAEPEVNDFQLVTTGHSNDYDRAIEDGFIDYLFVQEYNVYPQYDPEFIAESYNKIIEGSKVPVKTKVLIGEPTNALAGGTNTIYHPKGNATESLSTEAAIELMLPELEKIKHKPRFAGIIGWSLNTDYAADLYGDAKHQPGAFAKGLRECIYNNKCAPDASKIDGAVVAGFLPLWGKSSSYNISGQQINTTPIKITMPKDKEYCDENPDICKHNVIVVGNVSYSSSEGFKVSFREQNGGSNKLYTPKELKGFIDYMKSKGKHVIVSVGGKLSHIEWKSIDLNKLKKIVQEYGFNGINFDLGDSDIPKNQKNVDIAAQKITALINSLRHHDQHSDDFWLTFSPNWTYIVAPLDKNNKDNIYETHNYVDLINKIGISNVDYICLNTYSELATVGLLGPYKDKDGEYMKVSPADSYSKFLASLGWALTTQDGYSANLSKYRDEPLKIPAEKLVFIIPATEGASARGMIYVLSKKDIDETIVELEKNKASFGGFAIFSLDFDATNIPDGALTVGYSHKPWTTTNVIADISLPPVVSHIIDSPNQKKRTKPEQKSSINTGIIEYPNDLGSYTDKTIVAYQGKRYKCISSQVLKLCNDNAYIPNGLHGYLAWDELDKENKVVSKPIKRIISDDETPRYPDGIGDYKDGRIVVAGDRTFECIEGKTELCNTISYAPTGDQGYKAWADITADVTHLKDNDISSNKGDKPSGAEYIYPNGIEGYAAGTTVAIGQNVYRCKVGPESSLCVKEAYDPAGKFGSDAWAKV